MSDYIGSTSGILNYAGISPANELIICTEMGIRHELQINHPDKTFRFAGERQCNSMKKVTLEKVRDVLQTGAHEISVSDGLSGQAAASLHRMLLLAQ